MGVQNVDDFNERLYQRIEEKRKRIQNQSDGYDLSVTPEYPLEADISQLKLVPTHPPGSKPPRTRYGQPHLHYAVYYGHAYLGNLGLYKVEGEHGRNETRMIFEVQDPDEDLEYYLRDEIAAGKITLRPRDHRTRKASLRIE